MAGANTGQEAGPSGAGSDRAEDESNFRVTAPTVLLPKGGGAIRGVGEKFAANPVTGTGSMSVPIATSPGRSGFGPQLSLSYDSGAGNGPFGFGWSLSLPSVTRKTDKGLPRYFDAVDSDIFILSGAEDLVPVYRRDAHGWVRDASGNLVMHEDEVDGYLVRRYRPRIEGLFARIERWSKIDSLADVHWRSISKDNILTLYGFDGNSRIYDPLDPSRIFSWLICESRDDKGNGIRYLYKPEDGAYQPRPGQTDPFEQAHQLNRGNASDPRRRTQRYLQRVLYGNAKPLLDEEGQRPRYLSDLDAPPGDTSTHWLFEVRFDYGELDDRNPMGQPEKPWLYRPDAFSSYRSGFEVRTCRRCERVLMLHHIPDQPEGPGRAAQPGYEGAVRSTEFTYDDELEPGLSTRPIYSFLKQVVQSGWMQEGGSTRRRSLPPVEFLYTEPEVQDAVEEVDPASLGNLPIGLDGGSYRWNDLHGEGIPGILTEQAGAWYYKRNWSPVPDELPDGSEVVKATFSPLETVAFRPSVALSGGAEFMDLAGDGQPDVVVMEGPTPGLYEHDDAEGWQSFRAFTSRLNRNLRDPNLRFVDLDGDGHADVLITEDDAFVWHASLAEDGFGPARRVVQALDEEKGPRIVFADGAQSVYLADLSGDGLTDIVRIRNGEVCYWPNLGYGHFGAKVTMDNAPWFDHPDQFDHKRLRLADIDGSGTTDIVYLHRNGVRLYFNQSGNTWSQPRTLKVFPRIDDLVSIVPIDLLGNGTACLVWSSPLAGDSWRPMRYVNLMGDHKPHLLVKTINNLGAETCVSYAPSTKFYLLDKRDGKPWITRLPFPVHVVERVETWDHISRNRFVSRYAYHHGYFDGEEREFRGFGMVEQWDTEQFAALTTVGALLADNIAAESHVPPVHSKTWFHTGARIKGGQVSRQLEREYFLEGLDIETARPLLLDDTVLPDSVTTEEEREACRALKGSMLRQEIYADDAERPDATPEQIARARVPYTVTEQNFTIRTLQPKGANHHAVFFTHARETINYHYERNPADPRIQHALTLEVDDFGNVLKHVAIGYGRRTSPLATQWDRDRQTAPALTYTESRFTKDQATGTGAIDRDGIYRAPLPSEAVTFELTGYPATGSASRYQASDFVETDPAGRLRHKFNGPEVKYEATATGNRRRRPIERLRTLYRRDDLTGLLPLGDLQPLALPGESYKLAFTPGLLAQVFQRDGQALLPDLSQVLPIDTINSLAADRGGYVDLDDDHHWWLPSGRTFLSPNYGDDAAHELGYARDHFFLPLRYRDPFHTEDVKTESTIELDGHDLLMVETRDALGNRVTVEANDYRVLQARLVSDPNGNQTEVAFDTLGMVVGTAVMGKPTDNPRQGDLLDTSFQPDTTQWVNAFIERPRETSPDPNESIAVATRAAHDLLANATTRIVYDLERFMRLREPPFAATIARETHVSDLPTGERSKLQISFSYSDGFGREVQKKIQAETVQGSFGEAVLADRPLVHYRLDEAAGGNTALDASPQANHARISASGVTLGAPGLLARGTAALFDGQGRGRIVIPETPSLKPRRITIEAVVSWSGPNGFQQRIVEKSFSTASPTWPTYSLSVLDDGTVFFELVILNRPGIDAVRSSAKVMRDQTTHLVATYDGNTMAIYLNGVLDASLALVGEIYTGGGPGDVGIGNQAERDRPFKGLIDEVALYDRALSGDRIRAHFDKVGAMRPRWVGSGWTIFNNKGKPVRQYEPFFSATHNFEFAAIHGVSPVLFYDPAERVVATLHPNHTYDKVVFDPWQQTTWDVNDTCAPQEAQTGDPRTDPDIAGYVVAYFKAQPTGWKTWGEQRNTGGLGRHEQAAATRAAHHADTPTTAHFDALGRPFLTVARNRVVCASHDLDGTEESIATRVELDIEGNQRAVLDERKPPVNGLPVGALEQRIVMRYAYDMLGNRIRQLSMEAGARWMLNDVAGKPIRAWDSRGHNFVTAYDALRRPVEQYVVGTSAESDPRTRNAANPNGLLVDKIEYGEPPLNASPADEVPVQRLNLRTRIYQHFDSAGIATNACLNANRNPTEAYDFKGNLLCTTRRLATLYKDIPDWSQNPQPLVDAERFEASTRYDALNRPIQSVAPHSSVVRAQHPNRFNVIQSVFNEANLLDRVHVWLSRPDEPTGLLDPNSASPVGVANIDYDAKGQRTLIDYKTQSTQVIRTAYTYDKETFRLLHLYTRRGVDPQTALGVAFGEDSENPVPPPDTIPAPVTPPAGKGCGLQNLHYTCDPAGNITYIHDDAQQTIYFQNQRVEPSNDYTYDALYRLIQATGREHLGQGGAPIAHSYNDAGRVGVLSANPAGRFAPNDVSAMGTYTERYVYDAVGNFLQMQHERSDAAAPGWTRRYNYAEDSLVEPRTGKRSNRLSSTAVGNAPAEAYGHDAHGNMLRMPQLQDMQWDFKDQLLLTRRQRVNNDDADGIPHEGERTYYVYDASGQRLRKVTELSTGGVKDERIYLGGFEIFRKHGGAVGPVDASTATLERETLHVMDDKQRIALVETRTLDRAGNDQAPRQLIRYQLANHLGSATLELDVQAQIISYEEYAPYGNSTYQAVRSQTETTKRFRHTGKERDEESGLYYYGARYYVDWLARWISVDPIGLKDSLCVYEYVRGNPVRYVDRDGRLLEEGFLAKAATDLASVELAAGVGGTVAGGVALIILAIVAVPAMMYVGHTDIENRTRRYTADAEARHQEILRSQKQEQYYAPPTQQSVATAAKLLGKDPAQARDEFRRRTIEADNLVEDGVLTRREADDYIRTGVLSRDEFRDRRSSGVDFRLRASQKDFARYDAIPTGDTVVYTIRGHAGEVLYVGITAKTRGPDDPGGREAIHRLLEHLATKVGEFIGVASEFRIEGSYEVERDAHALEQELITKHDPVYNVDKDPFGTYQSGHPSADLPKFAEPELDPSNIPKTNLNIRIGIELR